MVEKPDQNAEEHPRLDLPLRAAHTPTQESSLAGGSSTTTARILWLRQRRSPNEAVTDLQKQLRSQGLDLVIADALNVSSKQLEGADLIFLDATEHIDGVVETTVFRIRLENRVPLVMLTQGYSTEQLVTALSAGADAIWSLDMPVEVLLARCRAMLRRWLTGFD